MKTECPRCGQGTLYKAIITEIGVKVVVCDEGEALWLNNMRKMEVTNFQDMVTFLHSKGVEGAWSSLMIETNGNH